MPYDESLAERIRGLLRRRRGVAERKMFGGLAFLVNGNLCCGVVGDELMVRVGPERYAAALSRKHARPMDFTGRPMRGLVYVARDGIRSRPALTGWVDQGVAFAAGLPAKERSGQPPRERRRSRRR